MAVVGMGSRKRVGLSAADCANECRRPRYKRRRSGLREGGVARARLVHSGGWRPQPPPTAGAGEAGLSGLSGLLDSPRCSAHARRRMASL